jgi:hypothetical protein
MITTTLILMKLLLMKSQTKILLTRKQRRRVARRRRLFRALAKPESDQQTGDIQGMISSKKSKKNDDFDFAVIDDVDGVEEANALDTQEKRYSNER